jgi:hypothetical protein
MRTSESPNNGYGQVGRTETVEHRCISKSFIDHEKQTLNEEAVSLLQRESIVFRKVAPSSSAIRLEDSAAIIVSAKETLRNNERCSGSSPALRKQPQLWELFLHERANVKQRAQRLQILNGGCENCRQPDLEAQNLGTTHRPDLFECALTASFVALFAATIVPVVATSISKVFSHVASSMTAAASNS